MIMSNATTTSRIQVTQQKIYSAFKYKVQDLIKLEKLKFEQSNGSVGVEDLFQAKAKMICNKERPQKRQILGRWQY